MTDDEAKSTVEEKLRKQQLTKPMSETEMMRFCDAMLRYLELPSKRALSDIRGWAESWQATWFRTEKPPAARMTSAPFNRKNRTYPPWQSWPSRFELASIPALIGSPL
jgi:hypothetical protein